MNALDRAIAHFGTATDLAKALGLSSMAITQWKRRGVPAERCPEIEAATGGAVTRLDLRPDIFGPLPEKRQPRPATEARDDHAA